MTDAEKDFKAKLEAAYPTRRLIIGRCAHLTEAQPHHQELGRAPCQYRSICERGCSYGAYFSSLSATLPAARKTGNLTIVTDSIVHSIDLRSEDRQGDGRAGDRRQDQGGPHLRGEGGVPLRLDDPHGADPAELEVRSLPQRASPTRSDAVGRYLMDHVNGTVAPAAPTGASNTAITAAAGRTASTSRATAT